MKPSFRSPRRTHEEFQRPGHRNLSHLRYGVCLDIEHVDFHEQRYGHPAVWDPDPDEVYWGTEIPAADEMLREHDTFVSLPDDDSYQMR